MNASGFQVPPNENGSFKLRGSPFLSLPCWELVPGGAALLPGPGEPPAPGHPEIPVATGFLRSPKKPFPLLASPQHPELRRLRVNHRIFLPCLSSQLVGIFSTS